MGRRAASVAVAGFVVMLAAGCGGGWWWGPSLRPGTNAGTAGWEIDYRIGDHTASTTFP